MSKAYCTKARNNYCWTRRQNQEMQLLQGDGAGMEKFFVQWCLSDMILNICTGSFIVYTMSNSKTKDAEYQIFVNWYDELVEVYFFHITLKSHESNV
jgi:hypothetical protein